VVALGLLWRRHWSVTLDAFAPAVRYPFRHHSQLVRVPEAFADGELRALLADPDLGRGLQASARPHRATGRVIPDRHRRPSPCRGVPASGAAG